MSAIEQTLFGGIAIASMVAGLFFFRFWHQTRDRFFLYFALSFWIEGLNRLALSLLEVGDEQSPLFYGVRLLAYGLILWAIWRKESRVTVTCVQEPVWCGPALLLTRRYSARLQRRACPNPFAPLLAALEP